MDRAKTDKWNTTLKVLPLHSRKNIGKKNHGYFTGICINKDFCIPFTYPWGNTFCSYNHSFFDREEYSISTSYQLELPLRKAQTPVPHSFGYLKLWRPLLKCWEQAPQPHTYWKSTRQRRRRHYICKKFYPGIQSQYKETHQASQPVCFRIRRVTSHSM